MPVKNKAVWRKAKNSRNGMEKKTLCYIYDGNLANLSLMKKLAVFLLGKFDVT